MQELRDSQLINQICSVVSNQKEKTNFLEVCLTYRCQLNCRYCSFGGCNIDISLETLSDVIDFLFTSKQNQLNFQFFGGEPLLRWDLIKWGTRYIRQKQKKHKKKVNLGIATNGILLTPDKFKFLRENNFYIVFSFDGAKETQLLNRPAFVKKRNEEYYHKILSNLNKLTTSGIPFFLNLIIGPQNIECLEENVDFLCKQGIKNIRLSYAVGIYWPRQYIKRLLATVKKIYLKKKLETPFLNIDHCTSEPILISSGLTIDCYGQIVLGSVLTLSKIFPSLLGLNQYGTIYDYNNMDIIKRNKRSEIRQALYLSKKDKREFKMVLNNIKLGFSYQKLFLYLLKITQAHQYHHLKRKSIIK
jgi:sulfatase maturation enzyme AslB (radical SAM superfamily)